MNQLKFRALDIYYNLIYFTFEQIPFVLPNIMKDTIEQYICRQDEYGHELYEGDIVEVYIKLSKIEFQGVISFKDSSFVIESEYFTHYSWIDYKIKKLGNKHENIDLYKEVINNE